MLLPEDQHQWDRFGKLLRLTVAPATISPIKGTFPSRRNWSRIKSFIWRHTCHMRAVESGYTRHSPSTWWLFLALHLPAGVSNHDTAPGFLHDVSPVNYDVINAFEVRWCNEKLEEAIKAISIHQFAHI